MGDRPAGQVERRVNTLADLHLSDQTIDSVIGHIGRLGVQALPGWDAVGASLVTNDKIATYGVTDDRINPVDQSQYDSGSGPCMDAAKKGDVHYFDGQQVPPAWRRFAR